MGEAFGRMADDYARNAGQEDQSPRPRKHVDASVRETDKTDTPQ